MILAKLNDPVDFSNYTFYIFCTYIGDFGKLRDCVKEPVNLATLII